MSTHERVVWYRARREAPVAKQKPLAPSAPMDGHFDERTLRSLRRGFQTHQSRQADLLVHPDFGIGIPVVEGADTAKKYAIGLLKLAAEIEHALMVQYLYAADSIDPEKDTENLAKKIRQVAIEEMGHLGTVQNLLLLLGGPQAFHMQRDVIRRKSPFNPIPLVLEPVTLLSLAKYVAAEMPEHVPEAHQAKVDELVALARSDLGFEPRRVGTVYAMIRWLFLPKAEALAWMDLKTLVPDAPLAAHPHLEESDFQPAAVIEAYELFGGDWGDDSSLFLLERATDRASALAALKLITEQGEGFERSEDAHFNEFLELVDAFEKAPFGRPIATSPTLSPGHGGEKPTVVTALYTGKWMEVQALQYQLLVVGLLHAMSLPRTGPDPTLAAARVELARQAIVVMRSTLLRLASHLISLPVGATGSAAAGPSFDLDPRVAETAGVADYLARQRAILTRLSVLYGEIKASPEFDAGSTIADFLRVLRRQDRERGDFLDTLPPPAMV
ncbi:hypothetical protein JQ597_29560 [Bradyrhizobium sp. AUGA SZCCT0177]|uniref:ferritin-like domain-containing protein n=1 Tax=Bradyrhizobium sp. AUGA SZCCT0177 TaxID=2807665 RepID=UPI001BA7738F|nr:ferritin-like domain-containing protein [Bradyrhizobium sp. AUGA SZCCT0177]MBR1286207.1 hypothetical protein [Bradyrhizobium sp. AUGA SZCCT0177]